MGTYEERARSMQNVLKEQRRKIVKFSIFGVTAFVLVVLGLMFSPVTTVPNGHRGVVTVLGEVQPKILQPGLSIVNPMAGVHDINVQLQKVDLKGDSASKDLQSIHTVLTVNYHLNPDSVNNLYRDIGMSYEQKVLVGLGQDTFKAIAAKYTAEELIAKREEVRSNIVSEFQKKTSHITGNTIVIDDVFISQFTFSDNFNKAIESKQEAEQMALKAKRDLDRIKLEADQKVAMAQAEATSLKLQKQELTPDLVKLREIEVQREAIKKWNGVLPTYTGNNLPMIQLK